MFLLKKRKYGIHRGMYVLLRFNLNLFCAICTTFESCKIGKGVWKNKNKNLHNFFKVVISCFYLFFLWSHSVVVSTADFESAIVGSNPAGTFYNLKKITGFGKVKQTWLTQSVECMPFKHMVKGSSPLLGIYFLKKYNKT